MAQGTKENFGGAWDPVGVGTQHFLDCEVEVSRSNALSFSVHEVFVRCMRGGCYKRKGATGVASMQ